MVGDQPFKHRYLIFFVEKNEKYFISIPVLIKTIANKSEWDGCNQKKTPIGSGLYND